MPKIAIQGGLGSFHEIAAQAYFGDDLELLCCETFQDVFSALHDQATNKVMVAIGNSRYGDINKVYDVLIANHVKKEALRYWISGEVYVPVTQCLLALPGTTLSDIQEVHSQAPALGQCTTFLHTKLPHAVLVEEEDTAGSAALVKKWRDEHKAAIASRRAAELHGLDVVVEGIQDDPVNVTRFLVIEGKRPDNLKQCNKSSILLRTPHKPGSLVKALTLFSDLEVNLSYLQSVPIPSSPFQYRFYIDLEAGIEEERVQKALQALAILDYEVDILGSYHKASLPQPEA